MIRRRSKVLASAAAVALATACDKTVEHDSFAFGTGSESPDGSTGDTGDPAPEPQTCAPGQTRACYTGPGGTEGVGSCAAGSQVCADGEWGACEDETLPAPEACNGQDDDCDGTPDNGNPGGGDGCTTDLLGPCEPGILTCQGGELVCSATVEAAEQEVCGNGVDDDCNGAVDDNCACSPAAPQEVCAPGERCSPSATGEATCEASTGTGVQGDPCDTDADCSATLACAGSILEAECTPWCTSDADCSYFEECVGFLAPQFVGDQEWGVCEASRH